VSFPDGRTTDVLLTIAFFALACAIIYSARRIPLILVSFWCCEESFRTIFFARASWGATLGSIHSQPFSRSLCELKLEESSAFTPRFL
jgi:hypothetical protein